MKSVEPDSLLVRGEQVQTTMDKRSGKKSAITVQMHEDEIDFII